MNAKKIIEAIKKHDKFLVVSHIGLEGDSIGSQFALQIMLKKLGKKVVVVNEDKPPSQYNFLDVNDDIITDTKSDIDYEAIVVLDCPVIKRIGKAKIFLNKKKFLINIDHHISNTNFGDINWVEPYASSCGEMVYKLFRVLDMPINRRCALFLYAAILTDTGSFAYENTTSDTHLIAAELIDKGLKPNFIHQALYENRTLPELELLKDALSTIKITDAGKLAYMHVSKKMLKAHDLGLEATEGFINYARSINGAEVAIIFLEDPFEKGLINISFRSKGRVNVDKTAALFGGGGHKNASGCVINGTLTSTIKKVVDTVKDNT